MTPPDVVPFLQRTELFARAPSSVLERVSGHLKRRPLADGEVLFQEGEPGDTAYFVVEGAIALSARGVRVARAEVGDCFGEFALIDDAPRSATATGDSDVILLEWTRKDFMDAVARSKTVAEAMFKGLTRKLREDVHYQVKTDRDLERARKVQMAMMPTEDASRGPVHIAGICRPALAVGGDYYDYFSLADGSIAIVVADVLGHGFDAGLLVAMIKSCVYTQVRVDAAPASVMAALNRIISRSLDTVLLTTCCYLVVDPAKGRLSYTNAGHVNPFFYRKSQRRLSRLESTDLILGFPGRENAPFHTRVNDWDEGDLALLFTDGISEAEDVDEREFGEERLGTLLHDAKDLAPSEIRRRVLAEVAAHGEGTEQKDDETLVVVKGIARAPRRRTRHR